MIVSKLGAFGVCVPPHFIFKIKRVSGIIGSQFLITLGEGEDMALDGLHTRALYLGHVAEDHNDVLRQINSLYCDKDGRPYTDVRVKRALIVYDPFEEDPPGMENVLKYRGIVPIYNENHEINNKNSDPDYCLSPDYAKPPEERVEERVAVDDTDLLLENVNDDEKKVAEREEEMERREAKSHAVVLEMLGDLPDADVAPAENVLFVCKLNPITTDDDLTLIFSRFDANARATVIRDPITQDSLCYAFVEFTSPQPCTEAYFKMNNVLVDDRRIKVDFSQSVSKEWNRYTQTLRRGRKGIKASSVPAERKETYHKKKHPNTTANSSLHTAPYRSHTTLHSPSTNDDDIKEPSQRSVEGIDEDSQSGREERRGKKHKKHSRDRARKYDDDHDSRSTGSRSCVSYSSRSERPSRHYKKHSKRRSASDDSFNHGRHYAKERRSRDRHHKKERKREGSRRKHSKKKYSSY
jgi:peptidyl-prolyl cis-trans isomerase-like 4